MTRDKILKGLNVNSFYGQLISVFGCSFILRAFNEQLSVTIILIYNMSEHVSRIIGNSFVQYKKFRVKVQKSYIPLTISLYVLDIISLIVYIINSNILFLLITDVIVLLFDVLRSTVIDDARVMICDKMLYRTQQRYRQIFQSCGTLVGSILGIIFASIYIHGEISKTIVIFCETLVTIGLIPKEIIYYNAVQYTKNNMD